MATFVCKLYKYIWKTVFDLIRSDAMTGQKIYPAESLEKIGTAYGGWIIPSVLIHEDSICYCAGVGEDISFDIGLIERFGCKVYAFDPTPKSIEFIKKHYQNHEHYHYDPVGIWDMDEDKRFYAPADQAHVSHSILNLQKTNEYFEAPCKKLSTVMREYGHKSLDILKLDIEGAEYRVLKTLVDEKLKVNIICVEYDEIFFPMDKGYKKRIKRSVRMLIASGYRLVSVDNSNYTFIKHPQQCLVKR